MPRLEKSENQEVKPYGINPQDNTKNFRERLMERFKPTEFVRVINVDNERYIWQYLPEDSEELTFSTDGMHRQANRGEPEIWQLDAGESETIVGANAYLMIEGLYKKLTEKKSISSGKTTEGVARNFNYSDAIAQEHWISKILLGKEVPTFNTIKEEEPIDHEAVDSAKRIIAKPTPAKV